MKRIIACLLLSSLTTIPTAAAEELETIFTKVNEYVDAENYPKAIAELEWANKELQKKHDAKLATMFPDTLIGFQGEKLKSQAVMGMKTVEKVYRKGQQKLRVSLVGGNMAGAGNMAAIGRMAAMMGNNGNAGSETFRIDGRTANLSVKEKRKRGELSVILESGDVLKFELSNAPTEQAETLKSAVNQVKVADLDNYLKGTAVKVSNTSETNS